MRGYSLLSSADYSRPNAAPFLTVIPALQHHRHPNRESAESWLTSSPELTLLAAGHFQQRYAPTDLLCWTTGLHIPRIESAEPLSELVSATHWPLPNSTTQPLNCYSSDRNTGPLSGRNRRRGAARGTHAVGGAVKLAPAAWVHRALSREPRSPHARRWHGG